MDKKNIGDNLLVERMSLKDLEEIKNILITEFDDFWNENILKSELENENSRYFVLRENNEIIGFGGFLITPDDAQITNIVIKKSKRNSGYGNFLFEFILEEAKKNSTNNEISLEVNEKNTYAIKLYENNGFEKIATRKKYYDGKFDAIIMRKM